MEAQTVAPEAAIIVCDGFTLPESFAESFRNLDFLSISIRKHSPGFEQPRNVGVRSLPSTCNHVWFLDSDCLPIPRCLEFYREAFEYTPAFDRILIGPYHWMPKGHRKIDTKIVNDPRMDLFKEFDYDSIFCFKLNIALACFSGNIVYPINEFKRVGGFWNELHMGRCEDGELGIRSSAMGVPMSVVPKAVAYHMGHDVNSAVVYKKNKRDVPMINERHPYIQQEGLIVVDRDGKRFDVKCGCGEQMNTLEIWSHKCSHSG